jgi:hypothetical protein
MYNLPQAFEPGSLAVACYFLHRHVLPNMQRKRFTCKHVKIFFRKNKKDLKEVAIDEISDPTLDFFNTHSHQINDFLYHIPSPYFLSLCFLLIAITILV